MIKLKNMIEYRKIWKCDFCQKEFLVNATEDPKYLNSCSKSMIDGSYYVAREVGKEEFHFCNIKCLTGWVVDEGTKEAFKEEVSVTPLDHDLPF